MGSSGQFFSFDEQQEPVSRSSPLCTRASLTLKAHCPALLRGNASGCASSALLPLSLLNHTELTRHHDGQPQLSALTSLPAGLPFVFLERGCRNSHGGLRPAPRLREVVLLRAIGKGKTLGDRSVRPHTTLHSQANAAAHPAEDWTVVL